MQYLRPLITALAIATQPVLAAEEAHAAAPADAQYRYRYVSLDQAVLPDGFAFFGPAAVVNSGKVYGTLFRSDDPDGCFPAIGVWQDGRVRVVVDGGFAGSTNDKGTVAGRVVRDCSGQLALFRRSGVEVVPEPPGALFSSFGQITNSGNVLIESAFLEEGFRFSISLYRRGVVVPVNLGPGNVLFSNVNGSGGMIAGTYVQPGAGSLSDSTRAFRHLTSSGATTFLQPRPTERASWGVAIHDNGDVLGYSFLDGSVVGVWRNRPGNPFQTYLVEGTTEFPDISNRLLWNQSGLIVVTRTIDNKSYIVPRPGVALNVADLTDHPPAAGLGTDVTDLNDRGDLLGETFDPETGDTLDHFLLQRVGKGRPAIATQEVASTRRHAPLPPRLRRALHPELFEARMREKTKTVID